MNKKYRLTDQTIEVNYLGDFLPLYRIQALKDFDDVRKGDLGGYIAGEENLSQDGDCWIYDTSRVFPESRVFENSKILGDSIIMDSSVVGGNARVEDRTVLKDNSRVRENARVDKCSYICDNALIEGFAIVEDSIVQGNSWIRGNSKVFNESNIEGNALITDYAQIDNAQIMGEVCIRGDAVVRSISDYIVIKKWWNDGGYWTWTKSNGKWQNMHFCGTPEELLDYNKDEKQFISEYYKLFKLVE